MALSEDEIDRAIKRVDDDWSLEEVHDALLQLRQERDELLRLGKAMREAQRDYFSQRLKDRLIYSKRLEKEFDDYIATLEPEKTE